MNQSCSKNLYKSCKLLLLTTTLSFIHHSSTTANGSSIEHRDIETYLKLQKYLSNYTKNTIRALRQKASSYSIKSGLLVKCIGEHYPIVITNDKVSDILKEVHDNAGHIPTILHKQDFIDQECKVKFSLTSLSVECGPCQKNQPP